MSVAKSCTVSLLSIEINRYDSDLLEIPLETGLHTREEMEDTVLTIPSGSFQLTINEDVDRKKLNFVITSNNIANVPKVGLIGNALNISAIVLIYRTPSLHNSFGFICASHLLADVGVLTVFSFWTAPAALLYVRYPAVVACVLLMGFSDQITQSYLAGRIGQFCTIFWNASIYGQLQTALNRLLAIISPILYKYDFGHMHLSLDYEVFDIHRVM
ncbi:hypothetical protein OSTOST_04591 [Ostertagia ostertagi]